MRTNLDNTMRGRRLRVLQLGKFYPPQLGGMESHVQTLCERLRQEVDVEVVVSNTEASTVREICDGVPVTRVARLAQVNSTSVNPAMVAEIRRSDADLIHLHWPNPMAALAYLMSGHKAKLVVTYHSDVVKQRILRQVFGPALRAVMERANAIVVSSVDYLETSAVLRAYRDRCHAIPFGISEANFSPADERAVREIRAQYGEEIVLSVGRLVDYKGFDTLIRAMVEARGRLLIAGDGPLRNSLEALARSLGLQERVVFCGELSDDRLRDLYHAAAIFALASTNRREAFGLVQAEAMAAAKPVINTRLDSGVPFVSLDRVTGLTVPHSDASALARAISLLLEDAALRAEFGQAARRRAEIMFRSATMGARTLRTYEIALSNELLPIAETQQTLGGRDNGGSIFANSSGRAASEAR
jgi:glycosyltransferase involved in cell wall biosynthesis